MVAVITCRRYCYLSKQARMPWQRWKRSNNAKDEAVLEKLLDFADNNSSPNGQKEGSHGATNYFYPKFSIKQTPNHDDPQFEFKCKHSVPYEFNHTLEEEGMGKVSIGTFHS